MRHVDAVVIGAGAVGLACAVALARRGLEVLVLERAARIGSETSSRSSEVIHAGLYYRPGSLKAELCVRGRDLLYAYCAERHVPHRRIGKLIIASSAHEEPELERIAARAEACGAGRLEQLTRRAAAEREPALDCAAALFSPMSGIFDSHLYAAALEAELEDLGGRAICRTTFAGSDQEEGRWRIRIAGEDEPVLAARLLVNAAGLHAPNVAEQIEGLTSDTVPEPVYARGCYFAYERPVPFRHLIYPVPVPGGLGTHLTLDLSGRARFGPNVQWIDAVDYTVSPDLHAEFLAAARLIWSGIEAEALHPDYAGVRPKVRTHQGIADDFLIHGPEVHGRPGLLNLFGIESPGLTASLAIGEKVAERLAA